MQSTRPEQNGDNAAEISVVAQNSTAPAVPTMTPVNQPINAHQNTSGNCHVNGRQNFGNGYPVHGHPSIGRSHPTNGQPNFRSGYPMHGHPSVGQSHPTNGQQNFGYGYPMSGHPSVGQSHPTNGPQSFGYGYPMSGHPGIGRSHPTNGPQNFGNGYHAYAHMGMNVGYDVYGHQGNGAGYHAYSHMGVNGGYDVYGHQSNGSGYHAYTHMGVNGGYDVHNSQANRGYHAHTQANFSGGYDTSNQQGADETATAHDDPNSGYQTENHQVPSYGYTKSAATVAPDVADETVSHSHTATVTNRVHTLSAAAKPWEDKSTVPSASVPQSSQMLPPAPSASVTQSTQTAPPVPSASVTQSTQTAPPEPSASVTQSTQTVPLEPSASVTQSSQTLPPTPDSRPLIVATSTSSRVSAALAVQGVVSSSSSASSQARPLNASSARDNRIAGANIGNARIHMSSMYGGNSDRVTRINAIKDLRSKKKIELTTLESSLGRGFDYKDKYWYGKKTAVVDRCARDFLTTFFHNLKWRRALMYNQEYRANAKPAKTSPSCIAFFTAQLQDEHGARLSECCIISVSRPEAAISKPKERAADAALVQALEDCVAQMNSANPEGMRYFVASHCSKAYNDMLMAGHSGNQNKIPEKSCAEKFFSSIIDKLFKEFGDRIKITGLITCNFYPYRDGQSSSRNNGLYDGIVDQPHYDDKKDFILKGLNDAADYRITAKPACNECQLNKEIHFCSWALSHQVATAASNDRSILSLSRSLSNPSEVGGEREVIDFLLQAADRSNDLANAAAVQQVSSSSAAPAAGAGAGSAVMPPLSGLSINGSSFFGATNPNDDRKEESRRSPSPFEEASEDEEEAEPGTSPRAHQ